jgi:glutamate-1-semialdehyde 2,1-aminomutase
MPVGVVCGPKDLMARGDARRAARVNYVIGTFAGHPLVMSTMNAFLKWLETPETIKSYENMHMNIESFIKRANEELTSNGYPVKLTNWFSVWSVLYTAPGRYHWMFQYYMKDAGINLSWVGSGRLLFSLDWQKSDYDRLLERLLIACESMQKGGWWEPPAANIKVSLMKEIGTAVMKNAIDSLMGKK